MSSLLVLLVGVLVVTVTRASPTGHHDSLRVSMKVAPLSDTIITEINQLKTSWTAGRNFEGRTLTEVRRLLGGRRSPFPRLRQDQPLTLDDIKSLPSEFDARTTWSRCPTVSLVRDQGSCGSCWAVAASSAMSDRRCIVTGVTDVLVSDEDVLTCCADCGDGCNGGYPSQAWSYWLRNGVVTGGLYGSTGSCQPYSFAPCEHHVNGSRPGCSGEFPTPQCQTKCQNGYSKSYQDDKTFGKDSYGVGPAVESIQFEILNRGPVSALFEVYSDFLSYKSGVYQQSSDDYLGNHVVKVIGWGTEQGLDYWLVANSWNSDWGDSGFFKIRRGSNECKFEDEMDAGNPLTGV